MKREGSTGSLFWFFRERIPPFLRENRKIIAQFAFTLLFIALGIWFIKHERAELVDVKNTLISGKVAMDAGWHRDNDDIYHSPGSDVCFFFCICSDQSFFI